MFKVASKTARAPRIKIISTYLLGIAFILCAVLSVSCGRDNDDLSGHDIVIPESAIRRLNNVIERAPYFQNVKNQKLDSIKNLYHKEEPGFRKWELARELAIQYRQLNADSAIHYGVQAEKLTPSDLLQPQSLQGSLSLANALSTAGLFIPAMQMLDSVAQLAEGIPSKIELWRSSRLFYSYMLAYVQDHGTIADNYRQKYIACDDSLLKYLPPSDTFYKFIKCERLVWENRIEDAKKKLEELMREMPEDSNIYGMSAFQLAIVFKDKGDFKGYVCNLALAAESDIRGCVKEGLALPTLANLLYAHGDLDDAFRYINYALEDANSANIRMRTVSIATLMPVIDEAYRKKIDTSKDMMTGYFVVTAVLFLIALILICVLFIWFKRIHAKDRKLASSSKKLEAYVGNFIGLCSNYAARLDQLTKLVNRKISSGQSEELLKIINSGRFDNDDNEEFYRLIDKALLDIFPHFVDNINTLLKPDKQVEILDNQPLSPELRIYAFVRLGIEQSTRIAQILDYSVNTVYAYRNRMRNRAIDRENFDAQVLSLGEGLHYFYPAKKGE